MGRGSFGLVGVSGYFIVVDRERDLGSGVTNPF